MRKGTALYVSCVIGAALASGALVYALAPRLAEGSVVQLAVICALALMAELLAFVVAGSVGGSIACIPYLAAILIVPTWPTLVAIIVVKSVAELRSESALKAIFNIASHSLASAIAILVFRGLGGLSLLTLQHVPLVQVSLRTGGQAFVAILTSFALNAAIVGGVIAITSGKSLKSVYSNTLHSTLGVTLLGTPVIFIFAWVFVTFGWIAAVTIWVPILGLRQIHKANLNLEQTNRELLELMVKSIEARDPYTSGHSRRVQHYSTIVARAIALGEREIAHVSRAALLHDVGKIHEKYGPILLKAERLSPDEWTIMQEHPIDGANLVATMSGLKDIVAPVRHHHENWDGTGYPEGLAGDLIPLASRIIRFADTLDAMTSERPYRRPLTEEKVRSEIVRGRGTQFDPDIADRLLSSPMWGSLFTPAAKTATPRTGLAVLRGSVRRESA